MVESLQTAVDTIFTQSQQQFWWDTLNQSCLSQMEGNIYTIGALGTTVLLIASRSWTNSILQVCFRIGRMGVLHGLLVSTSTCWSKRDWITPSIPVFAFWLTWFLGLGHNSLGTSNKAKGGPSRGGKGAFCRIKVMWFRETLWNPQQKQLTTQRSEGNTLKATTVAPSDLLTQ